MSARDELAEVIDLADERWQQKVVTTTQEWSRDIADALIAAGYWKPRTISTAEELDALPVGAIILDSDPDCCVKNGHGRWRSMSEPEDTYSSASIVGSLPAIVIYSPEES